MPKTVIISPYSRKLRNGKKSPKNYPYWMDVICGLYAKNIKLIQIGVEGEEKLSDEIIDEYKFNLSLNELKKLLNKCATWVSVDNFFPHLANIIKKPGIVIFGQSDPEIFGYPQNDNVLKDRKYLRPHQFDTWENVTYKKECFVNPKIIIDKVLRRLSDG